MSMWNLRYALCIPHTISTRHELCLIVSWDSLSRERLPRVPLKWTRTSVAEENLGRTSDVAATRRRRPKGSSAPPAGDHGGAAKRPGSPQQARFRDRLQHGCGGVLDLFTARRGCARAVRDRRT